MPWCDVDADDAAGSYLPLVYLAMNAMPLMMKKTNMMILMTMVVVMLVLYGP